MEIILKGKINQYLFRESRNVLSYPSYPKWKMRRMRRRAVVVVLVVIVV